MKRFCIINCFLLLVLPVALAQSKPEADSLYQKGQYEVAAKMYEQLLGKGENAYIYYNLGNAYYRMHDLAHAILNYERAALLEPGNPDIRFNLSLARSKTEDKVADTDQFFVFYWFNSIVNSHNTDGWAHMALVAFVMMLILIGVFFFGKLPVIRRIALYLSVFLFVCVVMFNVFALVQRNELLSKTRAIVMKTVPVRARPTTRETPCLHFIPERKWKCRITR